MTDKIFCLLNKTEYAKKEYNMKKIFSLILLLAICNSFFAYSQEDFVIYGDGIPSLEDLSRQLGNPITVITWRTERGNMRFKRAVLDGLYERRYIVNNGVAIFEDRAEMSGEWQEWYQTGANELAENQKLEATLQVASWRENGYVIRERDYHLTRINTD